MSLTALMHHLNFYKISIVYQARTWMITSEGKRYYRTTQPFTLQQGRPWAEDPFYHSQAQRLSQEQPS